MSPLSFERNGRRTRRNLAIQEHLFQLWKRNGHNSTGHLLTRNILPRPEYMVRLPIKPLPSEGTPFAASVIIISYEVEKCYLADFSAQNGLDKA